MMKTRDWVKSCVTMGLLSRLREDVLLSSLERVLGTDWADYDFSSDYGEFTGIVDIVEKEGIVEYKYYENQARKEVEELHEKYRDRQKTYYVNNPSSAAYENEQETQDTGAVLTPCTIYKSTNMID